MKNSKAQPKAKKKQNKNKEEESCYSWWFCCCKKKIPPPMEQREQKAQKQNENHTTRNIINTQQQRFKKEESAQEIANPMCKKYQQQNKSQTKVQVQVKTKVKDTVPNTYIMDNTKNIHPPPHLNENSKFPEEYKKSKQINKNDIIKYVQKSKNKSTLQALKTQLLIVDSALHQSGVSEHRLKTSQIYIIFCMLRNDQALKILLEILLIEEKPTINACLAAILAIRGYYVQIYNAKQALLKRDMEKFQNFFSCMGLKYGYIKSQFDNQPESFQISLNKQIISPGIFYTSYFSPQITNINSKQSNKMENMKVIIIDQIDQLLYDSKSIETCEDLPLSQFSTLTKHLKLVWRSVLIKCMQKYTLEEITHLNEDNFKQLNNITNELKSQMKKHLSSTSNQQKTKYKQLSYIQKCNDKFIQSALTALKYEPGKHYLIINDKIENISKQNSLQQNSYWLYGLKQFLQIKHDLNLQIQLINSNLINNISHCQKYNRIYSLTQTLKSNHQKQFLKQYYNIKTEQIPPHQQRNIQINNNSINYDEDDWLKYIYQKCLQVVQQQRAVLIVCQGFFDGYKIMNNFEKYQNGQFQQFTLKSFMTGQQFNESVIKCYDVIIVAQAAARYVDFKCSQKLVQKGGVHVMISYLPESNHRQIKLRLRAGRNQIPGSSQVVINYSNFYKNVGQSEIISKQVYKTMNLTQQIETIRNKRQELYDESKIILKLNNLINKNHNNKVVYNCLGQLAGYIRSHRMDPVKKKIFQEKWKMLYHKCQVDELNQIQKLQIIQCLKDNIQQISQELLKTSSYLRMYEFNNKINEQQQECQKMIKYFQNQQKSQNIFAILNGIINQVALSKSSQNRWIKMNKIQDLITKQKQCSLNNKLLDLSINFNNFLRIQTGINPKQSHTIKNDEKQDASIKNARRIFNFTQIACFNNIFDYISQEWSKCLPNIQFRPIQNLFLCTYRNNNNMKIMFQNISQYIPYIPSFNLEKEKIIREDKSFFIAILQIYFNFLIPFYIYGSIDVNGMKKYMYVLIQVQITNSEERNFYKQFFNLSGIQVDTIRKSDNYREKINKFSMIANNEVLKNIILEGRKIQQGNKIKIQQINKFESLLNKDIKELIQKTLRNDINLSENYQIKGQKFQKLICLQLNNISSDKIFINVEKSLNQFFKQYVQDKQIIELKSQQILNHFYIKKIIEQVVKKIIRSIDYQKLINQYKQQLNNTQNISFLDQQKQKCMTKEQQIKDINPYRCKNQIFENLNNKLNNQFIDHVIASYSKFTFNQSFHKIAQKLELFQKELYKIIK